MESIRYERPDLIAAIKKGNLEKVCSLTNHLNSNSLKSWRPGYDLLCESLENKYLEIAKILIKYDCRIFDGDERGTALHYAIIYGDFELIKTLIEKGSSLIVRDCKLMTAFHLFAKRVPVDDESSQILDLLLSTENIHINYKDTSTRFTLLHFAAQYGNNKMIPLLLSREAFIEGQGNRDQTPLHIASLNGQTETVRLLLSFGAQYDAEDYFGKTPLCLAVEKKYTETINVFLDFFLKLEPEAKLLWPIANDSMLVYCAVSTMDENILRMLLSRGAKPNNYAEKFGETALHLAVNMGNKEIIEILLEHGAELNKPQLINSRGSTELHIAAKKGYEEIFTILLNYGANPALVNNYNQNPLHIASEQGFFEIVAAIFKSECDIKSLFCRDAIEGRTPLHYAVMNCHVGMVNLFLDNNAPLNVLDNFGLSPLHLACRQGNKVIVELLVVYGAEIYSRYFDSELKETIESPIYFAAEEGNLDIVKILCVISDEWKKNPKDGYAVLFIAAYCGHEHVVEFLLLSGVNPNYDSENYLSPLHAASLNGHFKIVKNLLLHGANQFSTSLLAACFAGHESIVEILLPHGANVHAKLVLKNQKSVGPDECLLKYAITHEAYQLFYKDLRNDFKPIHCAAVKGNSEIIKMLLEYGADVNSTTGNNTTPLSIAVEKENVRAVDVLLQSGARIDLEVYGQYPFFIAIRKRNLEIVKLLFNYLNHEKFISNLILEDGFLPLLTAVIAEAPDVMEFFLQEKISPDYYYKHPYIPISNRRETDLRNEIPLHVAVENDNLDVIKVLIKFGASVNSKCVHGLNPLFHAVKADKIENLKFLLEHGANFEEQKNDGETLLHYAIGNRLSTRIIQFLLEYGADVFAEYRSLMPIEHFYQGIDREDSADEEEKMGKVNANNDYEEDEVLSLLLKFDSPVYVKIMDNQDTFFSLRTEIGMLNVVEILLQYGSDMRFFNKIKSSTLYQVCYQATEELIHSEDGTVYFNIDDESVCKSIDLASDDWMKHCSFEIYENLFNGVKTYDVYNAAIKMSEIYRNVTRICTRIVAKRKCAGQIVEEREMEVATSLFYKRFYQNCINELEEMKLTILSDSITFFDLLIGSDKKLTNYVRNKGVIRTMQEFDYHATFSIYEKDLKFQYRRGLEKGILKEKSVGFLNKVLGIKLPLLIVYEIFSYLNSADLRNLCRISDRFMFVTSDSEEEPNSEFW